MLFVNDINDAYVKRGIRSLYTNTQATPKGALLDPAWDRSVDIVPGMAMMHTTGDNVSLVNGTGAFVGFSDLFVAPGLGMDEVARAGINTFTYWQLGPDGEVDIVNFKGKAFDDDATWTEPGDGTYRLITYYSAGTKRGRLVPVGTASAGGNTVAGTPIARLLAVNSASSIRVGGLQGTV